MNNKNNGLIKQFSVIGAGTLITLLLGVVSTPIITRLVTPEAFGEFSLFQTYGNLAISILYLGLDQGFVRYFYEEDTIAYKHDLLYRSIKIPIYIISVFVLIMVFCLYMGYVNTELGITASILLIVYIYINMVKRFSDLVVRLQFHSKLYSLMNIINKIVYLIFAITLVLYMPISDSNALIIAFIIASIVTVVIAIFSEKSIWWYGKQESKDKNISIGYKTLIQYSYPYLFSMSITSLFQANDKLFVNRFGNSEDVGIFSSANSIVALISIIQTTFNTVWAPAAIEHYAKFPEDKSFHQKGNSIITVLMLFVGLTIILFKDLFIFFLGEDFHSAVYILPGLIFGPILYTISETTVNGIVFKEKSFFHVIISLGALAIDIVSNLFLVPKFGGVGAGLSTGLSYLVFFTLRTLISNRYYYIDFHLKKFYILIAISFGFAIYNSFNSFNIIILFWYFLCLIIMFLFYRATFKDIVKFGMKILKR